MAVPQEPSVSTQTRYINNAIELEWFFTSAPGDIDSYQAQWILTSEHPGDTDALNFSASSATHVSGNTYRYTINVSLPNGLYYIWLFARNTDGFSPASLGYFRVGPAPITPSMPNAVNGVSVSAFSRSALVAWNARSATPPVEDYEVRYQEGDTISETRQWESIGSTETRFRIPNLKPNTRYTAEVRAINDLGEGTPSQAVTFTTISHPWSVFLDFASVTDINANTYNSLWVTQNRIYLTPDTNASSFVLEAFDTSGTAITAEDKPFGVYDSGRIEALIPFGRNRVIGAYSNATNGAGGRVLIIRDFADGHGRYGAFEPRGSSEGSRLKDIKSIAVLPTGVLISDGGDSALTNATPDAGIYLMKFEDVINSLVTDESDTRPAYQTVSFQNGDLDDTITRYDLLASWGDRVYVSKETEIRTHDLDLRILDDEIIPLFDFETNEERRDMTVYGHYLYYLTTHKLMRLDLHKARAPLVKQTIYPQFIAEGSSLDLTQFAKGADMIAWGYRIYQPFLPIY